MLNNSKILFITDFILNVSLYKILIYIILLPIIIYFIKLYHKSVIADRQFLRNEIYIPIYEDIKKISKNISDYEDIYSKSSGNVRNSLIDTGKYNSIPKKLRKDIDSYYDRCEEYNKRLKSVNEEIYKIVNEEIKKIKTEKDHRKFLDDNKGNEWRYDEARKKRICNCCSIGIDLKFLIKGEMPNSVPHLNDKCNCLIMNRYNNNWDSTITIDDLNRNSLSLEDLFEKFIESVSKNYNVNKLRNLQNELKNSEKLLKRIQNRIQKPNLLFGILGI